MIDFSKNDEYSYYREDDKAEYKRIVNSDVPSAVRSYHYTHNVNGEKINIKDEAVSIVSKKHLPKALSDKIKSFSVDKYVTKKRTFKKKKSR
ncbi:MAG: hypothetical protein IJX99_05315 [Clostridia bacterium]|nr:hypothetical protein [Clostridia bacterium]MBQ8299268.1 hypothetical protein [Clostridia bacterium]